MDPPDADQSWSARRPSVCPIAGWFTSPFRSVAATPSRQLRPPRSSTGHITFGSLNDPCKINDPLLDLWSRLAAAGESSRLILHVPQVRDRQRILTSFQTRGIAPDRIEFAFVPRTQYLELYNRIDLALDPLPYNGITTTCDAPPATSPSSPSPATAPIAAVWRC